MSLCRNADKMEDLTMKNIKFTSGKNIYDFFILPTIRINSDCDITFVTVEWLWWFIGVKLYAD